jgi:hypothetical protein
MNKQIKEPELTDLIDELDPPYESEEELQIGRMLDQYGIPFFYKQATVIYHDGKNEIWKPTFTLPQYGCSLIDYIRDETAIPEKINIYHYNQIPATVIGPKYLDNPDWPQELYKTITENISMPFSLADYLKDRSR